MYFKNLHFKVFGLLRAVKGACFSLVQFLLLSFISPLECKGEGLAHCACFGKEWGDSMAFAGETGGGGRRNGETSHSQ